MMVILYQVLKESQSGWQFQMIWMHLQITLWNSLNEENKVSLFVRYIDIATGKYESKIIIRISNFLINRMIKQLHEQKGIV